MVLRIRDAVKSDIPQILAIYKHYVANIVITFLTKDPADAHISNRLTASQERGLPYLVAEDSSNSQIVGYASASAFRGFMLGYGHTVEMTVLVHPEHTNRGFVSFSMRELIQR